MLAFRCLLTAAAFSIALRADFSYEQTTKVTGGMMAGMMRMAGAFSKAARDPIQSTVMVKGDQLASISRDRIHVIDLNKETMTDINLANKTWSVITFAEMSEAMKKMAEKMGTEKNGQLNFSAHVKETGKTRVISGMNAKEMILTLALEGVDAKSGNKGSMDMQMDMWVAPNLPGYSEVRDFYRRMAEKISWSPMAGAMGPMMARNAKGMGELVKE